MQFLKNALLTLLVIFAPVKMMIVVTFVLLVADLITGVLAAHKRKEPITSMGFRRTITKLFIYEACLMLGFLAQNYLIGDLLPVVKMIGAFIGITEMKSILENLNDINGASMFSDLLTKLVKANVENK